MALRDDVLNFLDYVKVLFLYDEIQSAAGYRSTSDPHSLALNVSDPRFTNRPDVAGYYGEVPGYNGPVIRQDLLDYDVIVGVKIDPESAGDAAEDYLIQPNPIFDRIAKARAAGEEINALWLVGEFPELSRMLYPGSEVVWATGNREKYQGIQADILSREAVLSGVIALVGGTERVREFADYARILASTPRDIVTAEINRALTSIGDADRAAALTGNDLFDGLTDSDQHLFAGVFDNAFWELNRRGQGEIDAYRQANATLAQVLGERAFYQRQFSIAASGTASAWTLGLSDDVATRASIGAVLKTYATTKTIVAEGRHGKGLLGYQQWESAELADGDPVLLPVDYDNGDEITLIVASTATAGYYRMDGANDLNLDEVRDKALAIALGARLEAKHS